MFEEIAHNEAESLLCTHVLWGKLPAGHFWLADGIHMPPIEAGDYDGVWVLNRSDGGAQTLVYRYDEQPLVQLEMF